MGKNHNFIRCLRCLGQRKACIGYPCDRCNKVNAVCVPEQSRTRTLRPGAQPYQHAVPILAPQAPTPASQQAEEEEEAAYANGEDQVATELEDVQSAAPPGLPRLDSLRTKASGPDTWPKLRWSWVGNGQYCRKEGYERVMAKRRAATEMRKAKKAARLLQNDQEPDTPSRSDAQTQRSSDGQVPPSYGIDPVRSPFSGSFPDAAAQHARANPNITSSTFPPPSPRRVSPTYDHEVIHVGKPQDIVAAQQQHEAFYDQVSNTLPPGMTEKRIGKMPARDRDSALMPPPPLPISKAPPTRPTAPPSRSNDFAQTFQNIRNTHAAEAQYAEMGSRLSAQRVSTPLLPSQRTNTQSILMHPLAQARRNHATEAEYAALRSTPVARRVGTPPLPGQGSVAKARTSTSSAPALSTSSRPRPSPWWFTPLEIPFDSVGPTWSPHSQFEICLGCLRPAHPPGWRCTRPYFSRYGLQ